MKALVESYHNSKYTMKQSWVWVENNQVKMWEGKPVRISLGETGQYVMDLPKEIQDKGVVIKEKPEVIEQRIKRCLITAQINLKAILKNDQRRNEPVI